MNHIGTTLLGMINTTSYHTTNYQIAMWALSNLERIDHLTEPEMARACNVSKSSINRFCKELGYDTFRQFQLDVLRFQRQYATKYYLPASEISNPDGTLLENYAASVARNALKLAEHVDDAVLAQIAADLDEYEHVIVMGGQQSGDIACMLQHNLFGTGRVITAYTYGKEQREILSRLDSDTLLIVFSLFGNIFHRVMDNIGPFERPEHCKICWITSQAVLPPTIPIDTIIDCGLGWDLSAGNLAMELVANAIVMHYWHRHHPETAGYPAPLTR
ncbi:hypothetical protein B5F74_07955 [Collinsella sp. An271]|uniref:MurR/RpiR family transcriptional regulator n=1 Tax=Collinsella sp. An271 TaxID=1965616 RepID=UPI000B36E4D8|nr:MurR/RpiR family transcriptional regulator [Collinsella sp. An271]OUO59593.1 hypothetical protein B5F74_07955 [Collinsella sp. An271]